MLVKEIEEFYLNLLDYAGLQYADGVIKNKDPSISDLKIDGEFLTLPYFENTKNPNGRRIFHILNESYTHPYTDAFNLFKTRLTVEVNLRICSLILNLITISTDSVLQQKIKNSEAASLLANLPSPDPAMIEMFVKSIKEMKQKYQEEFIVGFQTKIGGSIKGVPYKALCTVAFNYLKEVTTAIDNNVSKIVDLKVRKKDLVYMDSLFRSIFEDPDNQEKYTGHSDSKVFRVLHSFLKATAIISNKINSVVECLSDIDGDIGDKLKEVVTDTSFIDNMHKLEKYAKEIRLFDSDEKTSQTVEQVENKEAPKFNPQMLNPQPTIQPVATQQQQNVQLSPEDIIRASISGGAQYPNAYVPVAQPQQMVPQYNPTMQMPQTQPIPNWMKAEMLKEQMVNNPQLAQQMMQPQVMQPQTVMTPQGPMLMQPQPMIPQQPAMYPQYQQYPQMQPQPVMTPQGPMVMQPQQAMYPQYQQYPQMQPQQTNGLQINPQLFNRTQAPYC